MKNTFKALILATALSATMAAPAMAYPHQHHNHAGFALGVGALALAGTALYMASYHPYYMPYAAYPVYQEPVAYYAAPPVQQVVYAQPQMIPQQPVQQQVAASDNGYCREYNTMSRINGVLTPTYGTACYQPDGSWQIVN